MRLYMWRGAQITETMAPDASGSARLASRAWRLLLLLSPLAATAFLPQHMMPSSSTTKELVAARAPGYTYNGPSTALWAKRRRKGDADADYERFDLDELRDEKRFEEVEEIDPEMYRPSKMECYVPPPTDVEYWDMPDTRYIAVGMDIEGEDVFFEQRLPNCYLHLAWERRSYLDKRSPVSVWWDYGLVKPDLQGNRGNLYGMNASSASLVKAFIELDPYKKLGVYKSLEGYRWRPLNETDLLYAPRVTWAVVALDKPGGLSLRKLTREAHLSYLRSSGRVVIAGPLFSLDDEDGSPIGSLVIFNAESDVDAAEFVANDPYTRAGLFHRSLVSGLCELDVTGQHLDSRWESAQVEENRYYDPVHELMVSWGLVKEPQQ